MCVPLWVVRVMTSQAQPSPLGRSAGRMPSKNPAIAPALSRWVTYWILGRTMSGSQSVSLSSGIERSTIFGGSLMWGPPSGVRSTGHDVADRLPIPGGRGDAGIAKVLLADLAGRRLLQGRHELEKARHRGARHPADAPVEEFHRIRGRAGRDDARLDLLLAAGAGGPDADHRALRHPRMGVEHLLDLVGGDVLPPPADAVLDAVDEPEPPARVQPAGVARVEPQVAPRLHGLLGHPVVAGREALGEAGA